MMGAVRLGPPRSGRSLQSKVAAVVVATVPPPRAAGEGVGQPGHGQELLGHRPRGVGLHFGHLVAHEAVGGLAPLHQVIDGHGVVEGRLRGAVAVGLVDQEPGGRAVAQALIGRDGGTRIVRVS